MSNATWMVRAGRGGDRVESFLEEGFAGVGFGASELKSIPTTVSREGMFDLMRVANPQGSIGKIKSGASQLYRFLSEIQVGDTIVTGDPGTRTYYVGRVETAPYVEAGAPLAIRRRVKWNGRVARDDLSVSALNTLGAIQTLFRLSDEVTQELAQHQHPIEQEPLLVVSKSSKTPTSEVVPEELLGAPEKSKSFIEDMINRLDWDELQDLVAGVLRAMGYKTRVSAPGPDRGVDIFASPDGLGLQEPRIFVEVKHREASMGAPAIRAFLGGRKASDKCLYVSTGGFKKDARYEADRSTIPITLVALPELRDLLLEHYDGLDEETRALVPLRRVYLPFDPNG